MNYSPLLSVCYIYPVNHIRAWMTCSFDAVDAVCHLFLEASDSVIASDIQPYDLYAYRFKGELMACRAVG